MKHWWNVSGTSPSGLRHNYVWHLRQLMYALIPPTVALLTLEACSRWQKKRSAAALHKELPNKQQESKTTKDGSNIASRHQKTKPTPMLSLSPLSSDKQPANRWTTASSWWKDQMMKLQNMFTQREVSNQPTSPSPSPDEIIPKVDQTLPQEKKDSDATSTDPAVLARLSAMESELLLLRQQVTWTNNSSSLQPQPQPPIIPTVRADDPIDTIQSTIEPHHPQNAGPMMWTSLSFLLILCRLWTSQAKFEPYVDNGGTVVGITGKNYAIIASDTRLSESYVIRSRNISKIFEVANGVYLAASGCLSDTIALSKVMQSEMKMYEWQNERKPTVSILAHCLANVLYSRRNFPYYSVCAVAGLDVTTGRGALYRYDAYGSFERVRAVCAGKGERLIQPLLDEITGMEEDEALFVFPGQLPTSMMLPIPTDHHPTAATTPGTTTTDSGVRENIRGKELDVEEACDLIVTAFRAAAEREISIGDGIDVCIIRTTTDEPRYGEGSHRQESHSIASGDTILDSDEIDDSHLMNETIVAQTVDQRIDGCIKTALNQRTPRISIERRSFSLPRH